MTPLPAATTPPNMSTQRRSQTSFLATETKVSPAVDSGDDLSREVMEALRAADKAVDSHSQRSALDRLARHLSQQAQQRGRTSVPKRPQRPS